MSLGSFFGGTGGSTSLGGGQTEESKEARALTHYTLELVTGEGFTKSSQFLTLPIAPQSLAIREPARMGVQQTLAGKYAEEWGSGFKTIQMDGHTGFAVKQPVAGEEPMDGYQAWKALVKMIRDYYDIADANVKAKTAKELKKVQLILHIWEEDEHWRVIPNGNEAFSRQRNSQSPTLFFFSLSFLVLADANEPEEPLDDGLLFGPGVFGVLGDLAGAVANFAEGATQFVGQIGEFMSGAAKTLDKIVNTAKAVVAAVVKPFKGVIDNIKKLQKGFRELAGAIRRTVGEVAKAIRWSRQAMCTFKKLGQLGNYLASLGDPAVREWRQLQRSLNRC